MTESLSSDWKISCEESAISPKLPTEKSCEESAISTSLLKERLCEESTISLAPTEAMPIKIMNINIAKLILNFIYKHPSKLNSSFNCFTTINYLIFDFLAYFKLFNHISFYD